GGGIFHFLPAGRVAELEHLFATPTAIDPVALAAAYGIEARRVERAGDVGPAVAAALQAGGVRVVVVPTDRHTNVARHHAPGAPSSSSCAGRVGEPGRAVLSGSASTACPALTLALSRPAASRAASVNTCNDTAFLDRTLCDAAGTSSLWVTPLNYGTGTGSP